MADQDIDLNSQISQSDYLSASSILIIHPGSRYLRIGRASDPFPQTVLHCIARKRTSQTNCSVYRDSLLIPGVKLEKKSLQKVEDCRAKVFQSLQSSIQSNGCRRYTVPSKHLFDLNTKVKAEELDDGNKVKWFQSCDDIVVGNDVLKLDPASDYNIHYPLRRGDVNLHSGIGGSQTAILADLETIWSNVIKNNLNIDLGDLKNYRVVLIIPALYKRSLIKHYLTMILSNLGFGGCFIIQDHVAATFGAGLGYACVVDIGDQKTSISCVEDGISHLETRLHIDYGGSDITQVLYYLLKKTKFPYKDCDPNNNNYDAEILRKIKEENCHLDLDQCGVEEKSFISSIPDKIPQKFTVYLGDDVFIAPAALFYPDLFSITSDKKSFRLMEKDLGDPEDPHDHIYLSDTSRKYTRTALPAEGTTIESNENATNADDELEIVNDVVENKGQRKILDSENTSLFSLDQAILKSIEACPNDELKKKMYSCILLVGGSSKFRGISNYLGGKLALQIPFQYRSDPTEIIVDAKDMCSSTTTWKGGAILACLESAQELWIRPEEWKKHGQKLLREKSPFPWN